MEITYHLSQFDGPLDMLLYMLDKAKIDIRDIFISEITDQYIQAVQNSPELDMEEASAFIAVAARLLEIKSYKLLPRPPAEEEEDPETAFIRQLEEYAAFKQIAQDMQSFEKPADFFDQIARGGRALCLGLSAEEVKAWSPVPLAIAETNGCCASRVEKIPPELNGLSNADWSWHGAMDFAAFTDRVPDGNSALRVVRHGQVPFQSLLSVNPSREEVVTLFLAMLELLKLGKITFTQEGIYGDITVACA